jgi:hypothetical protein
MTLPPAGESQSDAARSAHPLRSRLQWDAPFRPVPLGPLEPPRLFVVIDTEEEFDWSAPFSRSNTNVAAIRHIGRAQAIFDRYDVQPTYVIDYPVAAQEPGFAPLAEISASGRCSVGAHMHPWVTPPYSEEVNVRNSYMCNLPVDLQREKLRVLCDAIAVHFGLPRIFKAGRYGIDAATASILEEQGFCVDTSVCPRFDFSADGGPSFAEFEPTPFFLTPRVVEVPGTSDYVGWAGRWRLALHQTSTTPAALRCRLPGVLARLGAVSRIALSPEGNTFEEMRQLTGALIARGHRTFCLSFHSPSVDPGRTQYVRTAAELTTFLETIERYLEFFRGEIRGVPASMTEFYEGLAKAGVDR